jgi:hypothetical protein
MKRSVTLHRARWLLLIAACGVPLFSGCRNHHHPEDMATARFIDTMPGDDDLTVLVNGKSAFEHVEYRKSSGYAALPPGQYDVRVTSVDHTLLASLSAARLAKSEAYTVIAFPDSSSESGAALRVLHEGHPNPPSNDSAMLRFASATPEFSSLELALNNIVAVDGLRCGTESRRMTLSPGDYEAKLWSADSASSLLGPQPVHLAGGHSYTLVAMGRREDNTLSLQLYDDGE